MGGFAGGDEGGYWDDDSILDLIERKNQKKIKRKEKLYIETSDGGYSIKAHAKIDVSLKVTEEKDGRKSVQSHVKRVEEVYDTISFIPCKCETFMIEGCDAIPLESNSIFKAYQALDDFIADSDIVDFFNEYKVVVVKRISPSAGLGGSASDAASFIRLLKEVCNLIISNEELVKIGSEIGTYVPFFIYNYSSAYISGFGEIVEPMESDLRMI